MFWLSAFIMGIASGVVFQQQIGIVRLFETIARTEPPALSPHQQSCIDTLRGMPVPAGSAVLLGDSLIHSHEWHEVFRDPRVVSRAVSGVTSRDLADIADYQPASALFCLIGTNDAGLRVPPADFEANYMRILSAVPSHVRVHMISIPPIRRHGRHRVNPADVELLNALIKALAEKNGHEFIDLHAAICSHGVERMLCDDGLHLSPEGYSILSKMLAPGVATALAPIAPSPQR